MPAEVDFPDPEWAALSGTLLPGGYEIGEIIEADIHRARFHVRVLGDWSAKAIIDAFNASGPRAEEQIAVWMAAKELRDGPVSSPLSAGQFEHANTALIYAVFPAADETLAGVLRERALAVDEAREALSSLLRALEYLHARGWVHGHLSPEQVLAFGDSIRISTEYACPIDTLRPVELIPVRYVAPEAAESNTTAAADVWCLGATLFEALTQKEYLVNNHSEVLELPQPFNVIVDRCLDTNPQSRCTLAEIGQMTVSRPLAFAAAAAEGAPPITAPAVAAPPVMPFRQEPTPVLTRVARRHEEDTHGPSRLWIYIAVAGAIVLVLLFAALPRHRNPPAPVTAAIPANAVPAPQPAWATKTLLPEKSRPKAVSPRKTPAEESPTVNGPVWRVVVFTFAHEPDAQKKAHLVNEQHPDLAAKVFTPHGHAGVYLVTVGGKMTREEAARLRRRIIGLGLPRDSYIQNYKQ